MDIRLRLVRSVLATLVLAAPATAQPHRTENVILITIDGARGEEVFGGLDVVALASTLKDTPLEKSPIYTRYWAPTPDERRRKLMPFFWGTLMADHGSIAGNRAKGSVVQITNTLRFSYPGYAELLTGQAHDAEITSNDQRQNPFPTVLEFVRRKLRLEAKQVAVFASWRTFHWIVEHTPGTIFSNTGAEALTQRDPAAETCNRLQFEISPPWSDVRYDALTACLAQAYLRAERPRLLYLALDETDDWAHDGRYDRLMEAYARTDGLLRDLWTFINTDSHYRGKTTMIVTTDHGRGRTATDWRSHGKDVEGAQDIWIAIASPDSAVRGEWTGHAPLHQNQVAATVARLLGVDLREQHPAAGEAIPLRE